MKEKFHKFKFFRVLEKSSILEDPSFLISLIVPAYNEEERLGKMLEDTHTCMEDWRSRRRCVKFDDLFLLRLLKILVM